MVGAGIAGLAASVALAGAGHRVSLYEAAPQAGGRCRSFADRTLGATIDNGTHLLLDVNRHAMALLAAIGGDYALRPTDLPILDIVSRRLTALRPGRLPAGWGESLQALGLPWVTPRQTVADRLGHCRSYRSLWQPLCVSALNSPAETASAALLARLLRTLMLGGAPALRPVIFPAGLSAAFAAPALAFLAARGATIRFHHRLTAVGSDHLTFTGHAVPLAPDDRVILALPADGARRLIPALPDLATQAIANLHFRLAQPVALPGGQPFLAITGGRVHWLAARGDTLSATLSACAARPDPAEIWAEIAGSCGLDPHLPPHRLIFERRATLAHDPGTIAARPGPRTPWPHCFLAGDWLASPWPCTIEAAAASGLAAARLAVGQDDLIFPC